MGRLRYISNARTGTGGSIVEASTPLQFLDDSVYINSSTSGQLDLVATDVVVTGDFTVTGSLTYASIGVTLPQTLGGFLTVGSSDSGHTVTFWGDSGTKYWKWIDTTNTMDVKGDVDIEGTTTLTGGLTVSTTLAVAGNTTITAGTLTVGDTTPGDVKFIGDSDSHQWLWDVDGGTSSHGSVVIRGDWTCVGVIDITGDVAINGDVTMNGSDQINFNSSAANIQASASGVLELAATTIVLTGILTFTGAPTVSGTATFNGLVECESRLGVGGSGNLIALTAGTPTFEVWTTNNSGTATTAVASMFNATMTATSGVGRAIEAVLEVNDVKLGGWSNAIKGLIDFNTSGSISGLASAICAEMIMPGATMSGYGNYAGLEIEMVCPENWAGDPQSVGFMYFVNAAGTGSDTTAHFDDIGKFVTLMGLNDATTHLYYQNTLKCSVNETIKYIPLSSEEGTYTTAYPIVSTYSGGIGCYLHVTTSADARYGLYSLITSTNTTGSVFGVYGDVSWTHGTNGRPGLSGVKGRVTVDGNFTGGTNYVYGTTGELAFGSSADINSGASMFAALNAVIIGSSGTYTTGNICGLYIDNQFSAQLSGMSGYTSLLMMANNANATCVLDSAIHVSGASVVNLFTLIDCGAMMAAHGDPMLDIDHPANENSTGRIRINVDGDERWLYYYD